MWYRQIKTAQTNPWPWETNPDFWNDEWALLDFKMSDQYLDLLKQDKDMALKVIRRLRTLIPLPEPPVVDAPARIRELFGIGPEPYVTEKEGRVWAGFQVGDPSSHWMLPDATFTPEIRDHHKTSQQIYGHPGQFAASNHSGEMFDMGKRHNIVRVRIPNTHAEYRRGESHFLFYNRPTPAQKTWIDQHARDMDRNGGNFHFELYNNYNHTPLVSSNGFKAWNTVNWNEHYPEEPTQPAQSDEKVAARRNMWYRKAKLYSDPSQPALPFDPNEVRPKNQLWLHTPDVDNPAPAVTPHYSDDENFQNWHYGSQVVDAEGRPLVVYHGTSRSDRINNRFRKNRATSGPMPYFTDDPAIASQYAHNKDDTSLRYEASDEPLDNYVIDLPGERKPVSLARAWLFLTPQQRKTLLENLPNVRHADDNLQDIYLTQPGDGHQTDEGWKYDLRMHRGNPLHAAKEGWINSATLIHHPELFPKVLAAAGLPGVRYVDPNQKHPGVYPVHLRIRNPLDTSNIPDSVVKALKSAANRQKSNASEWGADMWDKNTRNPQTWIGMFDKDIADGTTVVWTSIPDWVTKTLEKMGYDGIKDTGGKMGGQAHNVWIPFGEHQVKSALHNMGDWDINKKRLDASSLAPIRTAIDLNKEADRLVALQDKLEQQHPNDPMLRQQLYNQALGVKASPLAGYTPEGVRDYIVKNMGLMYEGDNGTLMARPISTGDLRRVLWKLGYTDNILNQMMQLPAIKQLTAGKPFPVGYTSYAGEVMAAPQQQQQTVSAPQPTFQSPYGSVMQGSNVNQAIQQANQIQQSRFPGYGDIQPVNQNGLSQITSAPNTYNYSRLAQRSLRTSAPWDEDFDDDEDDFDDGSSNDEYWLRDGYAEYANGDVGDYSHDMIAESEILNRLGYDLEDGMDISPNKSSASDLISALAAGQAKTRNPYWEAFAEWAQQQHVENYGDDPTYHWGENYGFEEYIRWLHEHGLPADLRLTPEMVDHELKGFRDPRSHAVKSYGWARLKHQTIDVKDLSPQSMQNVVQGLYQAYGNRANRQTYELNVVDLNRVFHDVTLEEMKTGDVNKRLQDHFDDPFNVKPRAVADNPWSSHPIGKNVYRYQGASNHGSATVKVLAWNNDEDEDYDDLMDQSSSQNGNENAEYWLKNGGSERVPNDNDHQLIAEGEILNRLGYDLANDLGWKINSKSAQHHFNDLTDDYDYTYSPNWEPFKKWAIDNHESNIPNRKWNEDVIIDDYIKWLHEHKLPVHRRLSPEIVKRELDGIERAREHAMQYYGWARLEGRHITVWDASPQSLKAVADGLENAYGDRANNQTYMVEITSINRTFRDVTLEELQSGDLSSRRKERFDEPIPVAPRAVLDNQYSSDPIGKNVYRYPGASQGGAWYRRAKREKHTSAIVALFLPTEAARKIKMPQNKAGEADVEPSKAMHITLAFLGTAEDLDAKKSKIKKVLKEFAARHAPLVGTVSGTGRFFGKPGEKEAYYASFDCPELNSFREDLIDALETKAGVKISMSHGFTPHITLGYVEDEGLTPPYEPAQFEITFPDLTLAWAEEQTRFSFK